MHAGSHAPRLAHPPRTWARRPRLAMDHKLLWLRGYNPTSGCLERCMWDAPHVASRSPAVPATSGRRRRMGGPGQAPAAHALGHPQAAVLLQSVCICKLWARQCCSEPCTPGLNSSGTGSRPQLGPSSSSASPLRRAGDDGAPHCPQGCAPVRSRPGAVHPADRGDLRLEFQPHQVAQ